MVRWQETAAFHPRWVSGVWCALRGKRVAEDCSEWGFRKGRSHFSTAQLQNLFHCVAKVSLLESFLL